MPLTRPNLVPGIYRESSRTSQEGHWYDMDKARFRWGQPEKIGGWVPATSSLTAGVPRKIRTWRGNDNLIYTAVATTSKLYILTGGMYTNVTPIRRTAALTNAWTTTISTGAVSVNDNGNGAAVGDTTVYPSPVTIGGITLSGEYLVTSITDINNYVITSTTTATSSVSAGGGGPNSVQYEISTLPIDSTFDAGWGAGTWGSGGWGTARTGSTVLPAGTWSLDNWGDVLIASPFGGSIYKWDPVVDTTANRASLISATAPTQCNFVMVAPDVRFLLVLGGTPNGGSYDPLSVIWCTQDDYTTWAASITNSAGSLRISGKSLVCGIRAKDTICLFTESDCHALDYIAGDLIFGTRLLGDNAGCISPGGAVEYDGVAYWFGHHNFFYYDGSVHVLNSPVKTFVFNAVQFTQGQKIHVGVNDLYREIWFFYPSSMTDPANTAIDRYVIYSPVEQAWSIGSMQRDAWEGNEFNTVPYAADQTGQLWYQETTWDANGQAMDSFIESAAFDIGDGNQVMFIDKFIPDIDLIGNINVTIKSQKYPAGATISKGPYSIDPTTTKVDLRARGRYISVRMEDSDVGDYWTIAAIRFNARPDGFQ